MGFRTERDGCLWLRRGPLRSPRGAPQRESVALRMLKLFPEPKISRLEAPIVGLSRSRSRVMDGAETSMFERCKTAPPPRNEIGWMIGSPLPQLVRGSAGAVASFAEGTRKLLRPANVTGKAWGLSASSRTGRLQHRRTTNPVESPFAVLRMRTDVTPALQEGGRGCRGDAV